MASIADFIAFVKAYGVARQNRFRITMNLPEEVVQKINQELNTSFGDGLVRTFYNNSINRLQSTSTAELAVSIMAQSVVVPGLTVLAQDMIHQNSTRKIAYDKSYGDCDITFICSGNMIEKKIFDTWAGIIFRKDHTVAYFDNYVTDMLIEQLDEADNVVYEFKLTECYPSIINPLTLDRSTANQYQTCQVSFHFTKGKRVEDEFGTIRQRVTNDIYNQGLNTVRNVTRIPDIAFNISGFSQRGIDAYRNIETIKRSVDQGMVPKIAVSLFRGVRRDINSTAEFSSFERGSLVGYVDNIIDNTLRL